MSSRDIDRKVKQLQEMFPNHAVETVRRILLDQNGSVQSAINILLELKPDKRANQIEDEQLRNILPHNFLCWPQDIGYMKIFEDTSSNSLVDVDPYLRSEKVNLTADDFDVSSLSLESFRSTNPAAWQNFKKKFQNKIASGQI